MLASESGDQLWKHRPNSAVHQGHECDQPDRCADLQNHPARREFLTLASCFPAHHACLLRKVLSEHPIFAVPVKSVPERSTVGQMLRLARGNGLWWCIAARSFMGENTSFKKLSHVRLWIELRWVAGYCRLGPIGGTISSPWCGASSFSRMWCWTLSQLESLTSDSPLQMSRQASWTQASYVMPGLFPCM